MAQNKNVAIQLIDKNQDKLKSVALRKDLSFGDWRNSALMLIEDTDLNKCLDTHGGQVSLVNALKMAAVTRLSLLPTLGYACIVPRFNKQKKEWHASYQLEKNGMVKLSSDAGYTVDSFTLYENDEVKEFEHGQFSDRLVVRPALRKRGNVIGYFARATKEGKDGTKTLRVHYMDLDQVLDHAIKTASSYEVRSLLYRINRDSNIDDALKAIMEDRNVDYNLKQASWIKFFHGMSEKTVVKALLGKPCFSNILNVAANIEEAQETLIEDANVITVEVQNQGAVDTQRELESQQRKTNAKKSKQAPQQDAPPTQEAPPPEEAPFD